MPRVAQSVHDLAARALLLGADDPAGVIALTAAARSVVDGGGLDPAMAVLAERALAHLVAAADGDLEARGRSIDEAAQLFALSLIHI